MSELNTLIHETVRNWEERFAPIFADELRAKRKEKVGKVWRNVTIQPLALEPLSRPNASAKIMMGRINFPTLSANGGIRVSI